jgi:pimeloyl-ACP methyl ester carboxylesterase
LLIGIIVSKRRYPEPASLHEALREDRRVLARLLHPAAGVSIGGFWHFGVQGQVDTAAMLVEGREEAYLMPFYNQMSIHGGFAHYAPLVLAGATHGALDSIVDSVRRVSGRLGSDTVPGAGHTFAEDNPDWVVERLVRFFA